MNGRTIFLIVVFVALLAVWVVYASGWFDPAPPVRVIVQNNPTAGYGRRGMEHSVLFAFAPPLEVRRLAVYGAAEYASDAPVPAWELVSDEGSPPLRAIAYGQRARGLRPPQRGRRPLPLEPGQRYWVIVEALQGRAETPFTYDPREP